MKGLVVAMGRQTSAFGNGKLKIDKAAPHQI